MDLPKNIKDQILEFIGLPGLDWQTQKHFRKKIKRLQKQMRRLSDSFSLLDPKEDDYSDAYFAYNFPTNLMKVKAIMQRLVNIYPALLAKNTSFNICDIGCGEGAGMLGIYFSLNDFEKIKFTGIDLSLGMLRKCKIMMQAIKKSDVRVQTRLLHHDLSHGLLKKKKNKCDAIILANSLAEVFADQNIPVYFIERLLKSCSEQGIIIILEPATKELSRRLMLLRDDILKQEKAQVLLPCLHAEECPLTEIRQQKEWCHQSIAWDVPEYLKILNQGLNREIDRLKFSYMIIAQKGLRERIINKFFVISSLFREKGKLRCYLCTMNGRIELVLLKKNKSALNNEFNFIRKGDIIILDQVIKKKPDYWQVGTDTEVKIVDRMGSK